MPWLPSADCVQRLFALEESHAVTPVKAECRGMHPASLAHPSPYTCSTWPAESALSAAARTLSSRVNQQGYGQTGPAMRLPTKEAELLCRCGALACLHSCCPALCCSTHPACKVGGVGLGRAGVRRPAASQHLGRQGQDAAAAPRSASQHSLVSRERARNSHVCVGAVAQNNVARLQAGQAQGSGKPDRRAGG